MNVIPEKVDFKDLTGEEAIKIILALGELPAKDVRSLLNKLEAQLQAQRPKPPKKGDEQ